MLILFLLYSDVLLTKSCMYMYMYKKQVNFHSKAKEERHIVTVT